MIAPEPLLTAYLAVTNEAIICSRFLAKFAQNENNPIEKRNIAIEQIHDLQDATHVIVELLNSWERCDEESLRKTFLAAHDQKWKNKEQVSKIMLIEVLEKSISTTNEKSKKSWKFW